MLSSCRAFGGAPPYPVAGGGGMFSHECESDGDEYLSDAESRDNAVNASGKFGGVAGVLAGVHSYKQTLINITATAH